MAKQIFRYPPAPPVGSLTTFDNIVGLQLVTGGGLTQGNFQFTTAIYEKVNRNFDLGVFSQLYNLENLNIEDVEQTKKIIQKNFSVYPNFDISQITSFTLYGSLQKRLSASVTKIISYFPAALEVRGTTLSFTTGYTATNIAFDPIENLTTFDVDVPWIVNPFDIDFSVNAARNIQVRPIKVSKYRDLTNNYENFSLYFSALTTEYPVVDFIPSATLTAGTITFTVEGDPFSGQTISTETFIVKPNTQKTAEIFQDDFDEVEDFILNRNSQPKYTAIFEYPYYDSDGIFTLKVQSVTWVLDGLWNLDIVTSNFDTYLTTLSEIALNLDDYKTNLISRFLTTGAFKDFDTQDQKMEKILQIYGRSFDEVKKFIDALANMNSVNYVVGNDIPSQLLTNLAQTLGVNTNISPINNDQLLDAVFSTTTDQIYSGQAEEKTPSELNYQYFRNVILNSAYMFKSKGTRTSLEYIMRLIGAPEAITEFNEVVYLVDSKINVDQFKENYAKISGGTVYVEKPALDPTNTFSIQGVTYTGFTTNGEVQTVTTSRNDYGISDDGYPKSPTQTDDYFFQKGSGWFESSPKHRSPQVVDLENSQLDQNVPSVVTQLQPFSYGQEYLDRFTKFPFLNEGYTITKIYDNQKSWSVDDIGNRKNNSNFNGVDYTITNDKQLINSKNIELNINMGQGLVYDVWDMCVKYDYPIPNTGLTSPYPYPGAIDWTFVNPQPKQKTFFEFAQSFFTNMINVRNRQTIFDGKTGGYPTLQSIYWKYLQSQQTVGIPSNQFTYQKMIDYTLGIGDYWQRLLEQLVPATTLWLTGQKMENSIFHRQKFIWRRQRGCQFIQVECVPCTFDGQLFGYDCIDQTLRCELNFDSPQTYLTQVLSAVVKQSGYTQANCDLTSIVSEWFVDCRLDSTILVQEQFYTGYGFYDVPTVAQITAAIDDKLQELYNHGLNYYFAGKTLVISNSTCYDDFTNKKLYLNIGINASINCN